MRKKELTKEQKEYLKFTETESVVTKTIIIFYIAIIFLYIVAFFGTDIAPASLLFLLITLSIHTVISIISYIYLNSKHNRLYIAAYRNNEDIIHSGLFGELWQEFEYNQFWGLTDGKIEFSHAHNNTIEQIITRQKHEFSIEITSDNLYMICDEEADTFTESEIPLSDFNDISEVFMAIRKFVENKP